MAELMILDDDNMTSLVGEADIPMFIDLWAEWCMPCKRIEPVIEELAKEYHGKMRFSKLNVDENPITAKKYNIMSIPMFLIVNKNLEILESFIGAVPKKKFIDRIESALEKK